MSDYREQEFNKPGAEFRPLPKEFQSTSEFTSSKAVKNSKKTLTGKVKMLFYFVSATVVLGSYVVSGAIFGDAYREETIGSAVEEQITPGGNGGTLAHATPTPTGIEVQPGDNGEVTPVPLHEEGDKLYISRVYKWSQQNYSDAYDSNILASVVENDNKVRYIFYNGVADKDCAELEEACKILSSYLDDDFVLNWFEENKEATAQFVTGMADGRPVFDATDWFPDEFEYVVHGHRMRVEIMRVPGYVVTYNISKEKIDSGETTIYSSNYYSDGIYSYCYAAGVEFEIRGKFTQLD